MMNCTRLVSANHGKITMKITSFSTQRIGTPHALRSQHTVARASPISIPFLELPAQAFEEINDSATQAIDNAAAAAAAPILAPDDPVISVLFTTAVVALSIVTVGVAYLSLATWNDSRQENEDRLRSGISSPSLRKDNNSFFTTDTPSNDAGSMNGSKKKNPQTPSTNKGFGKK